MAPRPCAELVTRLMADRDDRRHEPAFLAHHPELWETELVLGWDDAVLACAFLEHAPERSTLVITLPEHLAPSLAVNERWGSAAWAEVCDTECAVFPPPDGLAAMRRVRAIEPLEGAEYGDQFVDEQRPEVFSVVLSHDGQLFVAASARRAVLFEVTDESRSRSNAGARLVSLFRNSETVAAGGFPGIFHRNRWRSAFLVNGSTGITDGRRSS